MRFHAYDLNDNCGTIFQVIGKFIDSSGIPKLLVDSGLLAEGSLGGLLKGTHFNRCKKLHPVAALSFKILHFEVFWKWYDEKEHAEKITMDEMLEILQNDSTNYATTDVAIPSLKDAMDQYHLYSQQTLHGQHGLTAQFVLIYVNLVELYQLLERSIRTSDVELFNYATYNMCAYFFVFNHQNYARWLTRNHDNFLNIQESHPGLIEEFKSGAMSIRRTAKNFCRSPIDLTLEQTINANAANKLTGITAFTNSLHARQRWSETHTIRTAIITNFLEFVDLVKYSETSESQYYSKIFSKQVESFLQQVRENINPFCCDINPSKLFNLSSGKSTSSQIAEFLLNVTTIGTKQKGEFIKECQIDSSRFNRPIKRHALKNFAFDSIQSKKSLPRQVDATKAERNILGQILCYSIDDKIDLLNVFAYPLTTFPHSLATFDGSMITNNQKNEITSLLSPKINREALPEFEVEIIDGFYFLSVLRDAPIKYEQFAIFILKKICDTNAREIHIIFDNDEKTPSIKDLDIKKKVYENPTQYKIKGPSQERSGNLLKCLANSHFKDELVNFFTNHWANDEASSSILGKKRVFLSLAYLYSNEFEKKKVVKNFENNHFELETKIILHAYKIAAKNILIKISTTDTLLIYLIYHMQFWQNGKNIWIETGDIHKNTVHLIDVSQIFRESTQSFINALPAWYVFSGCTYERSFFGKGRKSCMKALEKNAEFQKSFGNIGTSVNIEEDDITTLEEYTCQLYNSNAKTVNKARLNIFENSYKAKGTMHNFNKKGIILRIIHFT